MRDLVKKLFKSKAVQWETLTVDIGSEFLQLATSEGLLDLLKIQDHMPNKLTYYNSTTGFLSEYWAAKQNGIVINEPLIKNLLLKNTLKYNLAPTPIRDHISSAISRATEGIARRTPNGSKFLVTGSLSSEAKKILFLEQGIDAAFSQADLLFFNEALNCWTPISLKTTKSKIQNFGLKNTSPLYLVPSIYEHIFPIISVFFTKHGVNTDSLSQKELKQLIIEKNLNSEVDEYTRQVVYPKVTELLTSKLSSLDTPALVKLLSTLIDAKELTVIGTTHSGDYETTTDILKLLSGLEAYRQIKLKGTASFSLGNILSFRVKFSNGNLCSSLKLQIDCL